MTTYQVVTVFTGATTVAAAVVNPSTGDFRDFVYTYEIADKVVPNPQVLIDDAAHTITIKREATSAANATEYRDALEAFMTNHPDFAGFTSSTVVEVQ